MSSSDSSPHGEPAAAHLRTGPVEWHGRTAVLAVSGEIDMVTAPPFEEALKAVLRDLPETLVVDLTDVEFLASAGSTALVSAHQQAAEHTQLRVVALGGVTARPLWVTGLDQEIPVYASREQALEG